MILQAKKRENNIKFLFVNRNNRKNLEKDNYSNNYNKNRKIFLICFFFEN